MLKIIESQLNAIKGDNLSTHMWLGYHLYINLIALVPPQIHS